jgi:hypothetical protein
VDEDCCFSDTASTALFSETCSVRSDDCFSCASSSEEDAASDEMMVEEEEDVVVTAIPVLQVVELEKVVLKEEVLKEVQPASLLSSGHTSWSTRLYEMVAGSSSSSSSKRQAELAAIAVSPVA